MKQICLKKREYNHVFLVGSDVLFQASELMRLKKIGGRQRNNRPPSQEEPVILIKEPSTLYLRKNIRNAQVDTHPVSCQQFL